MAIPVGTTSRQLEWLARWLLAGVVVLALLTCWWPGYRSWGTVVAAEAAVLVQPSFAEGMPNTVLEAMAHGLPVVATAVAGVPEIVGDGETGFLIRERDPQLLASRIDTLLTERETWERMSKACRIRAQEYSPERALPRLEGVLEGLKDASGR